MATPYVLPAVQIFQEFQQVAPAITANLQALIAGPQAYLLRHSVAAEKPLGALGAYNPSAPATFSWPGRPAGALVDAAYTKIFLDDAKLEYFARFADTDGSIGPAAAKNQLHSTDTAGGFKAAVGFPRYTLLFDRDVRAGDLVTVRGVGTDSVVYNFSTYVAGVLSTGVDQVAATVQSAPAPSSGNGATQSVSSAVTLTSGTAANLTLTAGTGAYSALVDGGDVDTYTVRVTAGSAGGDLTTATLAISTATGLDDEAVVAPAASGSSFAVGFRGLTLTFTQTAGTPDLVVGQVWQVVVHSAYVAPTVSAAGTYAGTATTTYIVTVVTGGLFSAATRPRIAVSTTTGYDSSPPVTIPAGATTVPIGTQGVTFTVAATGTPIGLRKGDTWTVAVTPAAPGAYRTLVLGRNLPAALLGAPALDLHLALGRSIQVPAASATAGVANWTQLPQSFTVHAGIVAYDPSWTSSGVPLPLPVASASLSVEYRAWLVDYVGAVGTISDVGTIDAALAGPLDVDNPLKWGVFKALANANGANVLFTGVSDPASLPAWSQTVAILVGRQDVYNLVPLTADRPTQDLFAAHIADQSSAVAGRWRAGFFALTAAAEAVVVSAASSADLSPVLATFALDPQGTAASATIVEVPAANADFVTDGVRPGDVVRTSYATAADGTVTFAEYTVDAVLTEDSLRLLGGPPVITVPQMLEVWHVLSQDEVAAAVGRSAGSFATGRVCAVWPDQIGSGGTVMPGHFLCCALAGLVSGSAPQRGLTNVQVLGFDDVSRTTAAFNAAQLNVMAGDGVWVVTQDPDGAVKTRHAVTTDPTDVNTREEMVRRNVDSISLLFQSRLAPFVGVSNVTPSTVARINVELLSVIEFLKSNGFVDTLGPQLIDASVVSLAVSPLFADTLVGTINLTIPYPLNEIMIHLVI